MSKQQAVVMDLVLYYCLDGKDMEHAIFEREPFILKEGEAVGSVIDIHGLEVTLDQTYYSEEYDIPYYIGKIVRFENKQYYNMMRKFLLANGWARKVNLENWKIDRRK